MLHVPEQYDECRRKILKVVVAMNLGFRVQRYFTENLYETPMNTHTQRNNCNVYIYDNLAVAQRQPGTDPVAPWTKLEFFSTHYLKFSTNVMFSRACLDVWDTAYDRSSR